MLKFTRILSIQLIMNCTSNSVKPYKPNKPISSFPDPLRSPCQSTHQALLCLPDPLKDLSHLTHKKPNHPTHRQEDLPFPTHAEDLFFLFTKKACPRKLAKTHSPPKILNRPTLPNSYCKEPACLLYCATYQEDPGLLFHQHLFCPIY